MIGLSTDGRIETPWIASGLAALFPGLGHAYLRTWVRSVLWTTMFLGALVVTVPNEGSLASAATGTLLLLPAIWTMNVVDAYLTAARVGQTRGDQKCCPRCGNELDRDLDFCHWCTTRLDGTGVENR